MYIKATIVFGRGKSFSCSIETTENGVNFTPFDLNLFAIRFKVLGSPTSDAKVLLDHIITQNTDILTEGQIDDPDNGKFTFVVNAEDTKKLGLGHFPIAIELLDADTLEYVDTITEGKQGEEFNKIYITEV